ncbi:hypothetical protein ACJIZ3_019968 [Penstemon smallii]|uniref:Uncharacterized protein n=1 Tax=Penstemon smallii TaxID=265156 RepID=A0ABD3T3G8_9LAMI
MNRLLHKILVILSSSPRTLDYHKAILEDN